jgi:outer membrane protein
MRRMIGSAAFAAMALATSTALAQTPAGAKMPFPADARIAFVNPQYVFSASRDGKAAATELQSLQNKKNAAISAKTKEVEALEQKLAQNASMLNDDARSLLQRDVARAKVDFQRLVEDAEAEVQQKRQEFERAFSRKLFPAIGEVAKARNLWAVFSTESALMWHQPALDISDEIVGRLDGAAPPSGR